MLKLDGNKLIIDDKTLEPQTAEDGKTYYDTGAKFDIFHCGIDMGGTEALEKLMIAFNDYKEAYPKYKRSVDDLLALTQMFHGAICASHSEDYEKCLKKAGYDTKILNDDSFDFSMYITTGTIVIIKKEDK